MTEIRNPKQYDLEDRTLEFARKVRVFVKELQKTIANIEDTKQIIRASGSVGSNYIEANDSLSKKDSLCESKFVAKKQKKVDFGCIY